MIALNLTIALDYINFVLLIIELLSETVISSKKSSALMYPYSNENEKEL